MARTTRQYDQKYKAQSLKLAKELGSVARAATELGMPVGTLYGWMQAVR